jgi:hypothetical protein
MVDVKIVPVSKPKSFADVAFTKDEWDAAVKAGPKVMPVGAAREAVVQSKGLYVVKAAVDVEATAVKLVEPADMTNEQLAQESAAYGQPIRKQMSRSKLVEFITSQREKAVSFIVDDEDDDTAGE